VQHLARTIVVQYRNERGEVMAETHHYAAGRWRLASGYEDPTLINIDGELVDRWHKDDVRCVECGRWQQRAEESKELLPAPNLWRGAGS
jgi:hypothetical protein